MVHTGSVPDEAKAVPQGPDPTRTCVEEKDGPAPLLRALSTDKPLETDFPVADAPLSYSMLGVPLHTTPAEAVSTARTAHVASLTQLCVGRVARALAVAPDDKLGEWAQTLRAQLPPALLEAVFAELREPTALSGQVDEDAKMESKVKAYSSTTHTRRRVRKKPLLSGPLLVGLKDALAGLRSLSFHTVPVALHQLHSLAPHLANLTSLDLRSCFEFSDLDPLFQAPLSLRCSLRHLNLGRCKRFAHASSARSSLSPFQALEFLNITGTRIDNLVNLGVPSLTSLRHLDVSYTSVARDAEDTDVVLTLQSCVSLTDLNLSGTLVSGPALLEVQRLSALRRVGLSFLHRVPDSAWDALTVKPSTLLLVPQHVPTGTAGSTGSTAEVTEDVTEAKDTTGPHGSGHIEPCFPHLQVLDLSRNPALGDRAVRFLCHMSPALRQLDLSRTAITSAQVLSVRSSMHLQELNLSHCHISHADVLCLQQFVKLKKLRLAYTHMDRWGWQETVLAALPLLQELNYDASADEDVERLSIVAPQLRHLVLRGFGLTDAVLSTLAEMPTLAWISLWQTSISELAVAVFCQQQGYAQDGSMSSSAGNYFLLRVRPPSAPSPATAVASASS